jgi:hypothetical protein
MIIFIVTAYHAGWTNAAQYVVGGTLQLSAAIKMAEQEHFRQQGGYGVQVQQWVDGIHGDPQAAHYCASSRGEHAPSEHPQQRLYLELGKRVVLAVEKKTRVTPALSAPYAPVIEHIHVPRWLTEEKNQAERVLFK